MKENQILENKEIRDKNINRVEVLDKVKELLLLGKEEVATSKMVSEYFEVPLATIKDQIRNNKDEFMLDGLTIRHKEELKKFKAETGFEAKAPSLTLFPKRAILRMGMLLRDSEVAKEIRTRLLDVIHDTEKNAPEIITAITNEIDDEMKLSMELFQAMNNGDLELESKIKTKIIALKENQKRVVEADNAKLTENINSIVNNNLTILEFSPLFNKIIKKVVSLKYSGDFQQGYGSFYTFLNSKLKINLKLRKTNEIKRLEIEYSKKGKDVPPSRIKGITAPKLIREDEYNKVIEIAKSWAYSLNVDILEIDKLH